VSRTAWRPQRRTWKQTFRRWLLADFLPWYERHTDEREWVGVIALIGILGLCLVWMGRIG
jgi:hypothetical protein